MSDINKVTLRGRIDGEVTLRPTTNSQVVNFMIATQGEKQKFPLRHKCCAWGELARRVSELRDGDAICVEGRLQTRSYEARDTGEKRWVTEVVLDTILDDASVTTEDGQEGMPF